MRQKCGRNECVAHSKFGKSEKHFINRNKVLHINNNTRMRKARLNVFACFHITFGGGAFFLCASLSAAIHNFIVCACVRAHTHIHTSDKCVRALLFTYTYTYYSIIDARLSACAQNTAHVCTHTRAHNSFKCKVSERVKRWRQRRRDGVSSRGLPQRRRGRKEGRRFCFLRVKL